METTSLQPLDGNELTRREIDIDASAPLKLSVTNSKGDVTITAADRANILVVAERNDSGNDDEAGIIVDVKGNKISVHPNWQVSGSLGEIAKKVKTQLKEGFKSEEWDFKNFRMGFNADFDIRIELPRTLADDSAVNIKTASGDTSVSDVTARVSAATANGDINASRLNGKVSVHSASGDLQVRDVTGSLEANTANGEISVSGGDAWAALRAVNGDISVNGFTMRNARVTTVSGDINVEATLDNLADYSFDTVSGDISLRPMLPASGATLTYKAVSGDANVSGDWTRGDSKRTWTLNGATDGPRISVKAVSGDLSATATASGDTTLRHETPPSAPAEDVKEDEDADMTAGTADFDWEKARNWMSSVTQKIGKIVNDLDEAGDHHRHHRGHHPHGTSASVEPLDPRMPTPPAPPAEPTSPPTPPPGAQDIPQADTEPVQVPPAYSETAPFTPADPEAAAGDAPGETTSQKRLRLLEAVQRGEMTVDEALAQLDGDTTDS